MSTNIVALNADTQISDYAYVRTIDGQRVTQHGSCSAQLMPACDDWLGLVPVSRVSWHQIDLPKVAAKQLRAALSGLMEDLVIDDVDDLHFALAKDAKPGDKGVWVAVVEKSWLNAAIKPLQEKFIGKRWRLAPEMWPNANATETPLHAVTKRDHSDWLWRADANGVHSWPLNAAPQAVLHDEHAKRVAEPASVQAAENAMQQGVESVPRVQQLMSALNGPWDLAQFSFAAPSGFGAFAQGMRLDHMARNLIFAPTWRYARIGLLALLAINLLGLNIYAWRQKAMLNAKRVQMENILKTSFPKTQLVIDAPMQMQKEVDNLKAKSADQVSEVAQLLQAVQDSAPNVQLSNIEFSGRSLFVKAAELPPEAQAKLKALGIAIGNKGELLSLTQSKS